MSEQLTVIDDNFSPVNSFSFEATKLNNLHRKIEYEINEAKASVNRAVDYAVEFGSVLNAVKKGLPHGNFLPWIEANCTFSYMTATQYMKMAKCVPSLEPNIKRTLDLLPNITSIIQVLTASEEVKAEVLTALDNGEKLNAEDIKKIKREKAKAEKEKEEAANKANELELALKAQEQRNSELNAALTAERQGVLRAVDEKLAEQKQEITQQVRAEVEEQAQESIASLEKDYLEKIESLQEKVSEKDQVIQRLQTAPAPAIVLKDTAIYERSVQSIKIALDSAGNTIENSALLKNLKEGKNAISNKSKKQLLEVVANHEFMLSTIKEILSS